MKQTEKGRERERVRERNDRMIEVRPRRETVLEKIKHVSVNCGGAAGHIDKRIS